jgi:tetratricopeptide (TPR) repeat protein
MPHASCTSGFVQRRFAGGFVAAALVGLQCLCTGGCQMFRHQGPVSKSVAESRQLSQRGLGAMERGDVDAAEKLLGDAVKACPTDIDARRQYAEALWQSGQRDRALAQIEQCLSQSPDDTSLMVRAGEMQLSLGSLDKALHFADQSLDIDPHEPRAWALRAHVEQNAGQFEQALADFHRALEFNHDDRQLLFETAELYRQLNRPQRALSTLTCLCETYAPGEEPQQVLYLQGLSLSALGRNDDAVDAFALALDHGPTTPELLARLADAQLAAGRQQEADQSVQRALAIDPNHAPSRALRERIDLAARPRTAFYP